MLLTRFTLPWTHEWGIWWLRPGPWHLVRSGAWWVPAQIAACGGAVGRAGRERPGSDLRRAAATQPAGHRAAASPRLLAASQCRANDPRWCRFL